MKKSVIYIAILLLLIGFSACEDFLQNNPQGELTQEVFPSTTADAQLAVNAVYATLRNWHFHSGGFPILDFMSDDSHKGSNPNDQASTLNPYDDFTFTATQDGLDRWWSALYEGIKRANVVIEKVPLIDLSVPLKNRYIGEARFLRALYYFDLVRAWGGVPIVTTTNPPLKLERSSLEQVYALIIEDLEYAIINLPLRSTYGMEDEGRASKGAAQTLRAKVALYQHDFQTAEEQILDVVRSNEYDLESSFADANSLTGEHSVESVFEIGAIGIEGGDGAGNQYANTQGVRGTPNKGWGFNCPSENLRHSFENNDPRLDYTIIDLNEVIDGITILGDGTTPDVLTDENGQIIQRECYNQKVWIPGANTISQWGHNRRLIRYAEVLLIAAEALNENNKSTDGVYYINLVRERAREGSEDILPDIETTDKNELRDLILEERRSELALEGHRFWDLVRTGSAGRILGPLGFVEGKNGLLPIPQTEIDISQEIITQNPNY